MAFSQSSRGSVIGSGGRSMRQHAFARLGIALNLPVSAPDILARAGLDFEVTTRPVLTLDDDGNTVTIPGKRATFRADESRPLGVVGERYEPFQNTAMRDALETMAGPSAIIENGGTTDGGAGTWLLAQAPSLDFTIGKDGARGYMLIENRHDGMGSLSVTPVSVRQVCMNGMMMTIRHAASRFRHSASIHVRMANAAASYAEGVAMFSGTVDVLRRLAQVEATEQTMLKLMRQTWEVTTETLKDETDRAKTIRANRERAILRIRESATCNVEGTAGSVFSDLQAVTEYLDHGIADESGESAIFGSSAVRKEEATAIAMELAGLV